VAQQQASSAADTPGKGCASFLVVLSVALPFVVALVVALSLDWSLLGAFLTYLAVINLTTIALYRYDKSIADGKRFRIPEEDLLLLAMLGGSFGAALAMHLPVDQKHKHKVSKPEFQRRFWAIVGLQIVILIGLLLFYSNRVAAQ
jgi:uncharacterized membrane protein YsdA (DUF1294 family)